MEQCKSLSSRLRELEDGFPDYWTFNGRDRRVGAHAMYQYPAMMVPQMQGAILDVLREVAPSHKLILDPFVGSGTTLVEAMTRGMDFSGLDINPLAILVSKAKSTILLPGQLSASSKEIAARIKADRGRSYFVKFEKQAKWFTGSASIGLSRIARAIEAESDLNVRRVFWVVLARAVRNCCNSRRSTYKLHIKQNVGISEPINALAEFEAQTSAVLSALTTHYELLKDSSVLSENGYTGNIKLKVGDVLKEGLLPKKAHIVITSPPYGDNGTTIPYGQYSYLPLRWIPLDDIDSGLSADLIANTHATDTASLGGSLADAVSRGNEACGTLESFRQTMRKLRGDVHAQKRFSSFAADLRSSIQILALNTAHGGFHVWTVGERRISGLRIPMAQLLTEMLAEEGIRLEYSATRRILSKRMAQRNTLSQTMDAEQVLIAQRALQ